MKTNFFQADRDYRAKLEAIGDLDNAFAAACAVGIVDWRGNDLTRAVLARMKSHYTSQERIKSLLGKRYATAAADFFVETVAFYLKVAIEIQKLKLRVASEEPVNTNVVKFLRLGAKIQKLKRDAASEKTAIPRQGVIRPDISVWKRDEDELVAAIECKTQLGWNRDKWRQDFMEREKRLKQQRPKAKLFLLVLTERNWGGFGDDPRCNKQFFALLDKDHWFGDAFASRPTDVEPSAPTIAGLVHPIENLFRLVLG